MTDFILICFLARKRCLSAIYRHRRVYIWPVQASDHRLVSFVLGTIFSDLSRPQGGSLPLTVILGKHPFLTISFSISLHFSVCLLDFLFFALLYILLLSTFSFLYLSLFLSFFFLYFFLSLSLILTHIPSVSSYFKSFLSFCFPLFLFHMFFLLISPS